MSTRAKMEIIGFFPQEESTDVIVTGVVGRGEEGRESSGDVDRSFTYGYSTRTE